MKVLRSSPLRLLADASLLQEVIFCCWVCLAGAGASPFRQLLMKVLRSSPFLPVACVLHVDMRCCCGVSSFLAAACGAAIALAEKASREATARTRSCIHMANPYVTPGESGVSELTAVVPLATPWPAAAGSPMNRLLHTAATRWAGADSLVPHHSRNALGGSRFIGDAAGRPHPIALTPQAALVDDAERRGPSFSAWRISSTMRSTSALVTRKWGVKRSELAPPWMTPTPRSRMYSSVEPSP